MAISNNALLARNLALIVLGMIMLSYASVPLYRMFCEVTGFGGTTQRAETLPDQVLDRKITVSFNADISPDLPWKFKPDQHEVVVNIGQQQLVSYSATNESVQAVSGMSTYNVTPHIAGKYFNKLECFCFEEQKLLPGQSVHMPVSFFLDPEMVNDPDLEGITHITLSYTFFPYKK